MAANGDFISAWRLIILTNFYRLEVSKTQRNKLDFL